MRLSGGTNLLTNPGFENGGTNWITAGVFIIVQNPLFAEAQASLFTEVLLRL